MDAILTILIVLVLVGTCFAWSIRQAKKAGGQTRRQPKTIRQAAKLGQQKQPIPKAQAGVKQAPKPAKRSVSVGRQSTPLPVSPEAFVQKEEQPAREKNRKAQRQSDQLEQAIVWGEILGKPKGLD